LDISPFLLLRFLERPPACSTYALLFFNEGGGKTSGSLVWEEECFIEKPEGKGEGKSYLSEKPPAVIDQVDGCRGVFLLSSFSFPF